MKSTRNEKHLRVHPGLQSCFGYCLYKAGLQLRHRATEALARLGLQPPHLGLLTLLDREEPVNQATLGEELGIDKATMVKLIDILQSKGAVERITQPGDRRAKLIRLTRKGRALRERALQIASEVENEFLAAVSAAEANTLRRLAPRLVRLTY